MRIAHFSDLHLMGEGRVPLWKYLNKRATGLANLVLRRHAVHRPSHVAAVARELRARDVDHVVVTGDLSNLALDKEFRAARVLFEDVLGLGPDRVSVVPGNHDLYTSGSARKKRFYGWFSQYVTSDLPDVGVELPAGCFPFVRLRGPVAIIGLSTAVPRAPFLAAGQVGKAQLEALRRILAHPEVRRRVPVVLQHHPLHNPSSRRRTITNGLWDAGDLRSVLGPVPRGLVLHGHLHERLHRRVPTSAGVVDEVGATSASLEHEDGHRMAGFNLYEVGDDGLVGSPQALVLKPDGAFEERTVRTVS